MGRGGLLSLDGGIAYLISSRPEAGKKQIGGRSPRGRRATPEQEGHAHRPSAGLGSTRDLLNPHSGRRMRQERTPPPPPESAFTVGPHTAAQSHHPCPGQSRTHPGIPSKSGRRNLGRQRPQLSELLGRGSARELNMPFPNPGGDASVLKHLAYIEEPRHHDGKVGTSMAPGSHTNGSFPPKLPSGVTPPWLSGPVLPSYSPWAPILAESEMCPPCLQRPARVRLETLLGRQSQHWPGLGPQATSGLTTRLPLFLVISPDPSLPQPTIRPDSTLLADDRLNIKRQQKGSGEGRQTLTK